MQELDRVAAILKPTEKMLAWINEHAVENKTLVLEDISTDCTVILLPAFDDEEEAESYLMQVYEELFTNELSSWNDDMTTWPAQRSIDIFLEWFDIEFHSVVYDVADEVDTEDDTDIDDVTRVLQ